MKKTGIILGIVFLIVLGAALAKDLLIRTAVIRAAKVFAGVDISIERMSVDLFRQEISMHGTRIHHPSGFPVHAGNVMADIPEIMIKTDLAALGKNLLHVPYARLHIQELRLVRKKDGRLNTDVLQDAVSGQAASAKKDRSSPKDAPKMKMRFDLISLNVGRLVIEDYSSGKDRPKVTVIEINIKDQEFRDITSPEQLGSAVFFKALLPAGVDGIFSFGSGTFKTAAEKVLNVADGLLKGLTN